MVSAEDDERDLGTPTDPRIRAGVARIEKESERERARTRWESVLRGVLD